MPTSIKSCAKRAAVSGVSSAGLTIIVQPAAIAGATLRVSIASGKFHGVINRQGPTGLRVTTWRLLPSGDGAARPWGRTASPANQRRNAAA